MVNQFKISRTIRQADRIIKGFTNPDGSIDEKKKRKAISNLYKSHEEGKYSSVEVVAFTSLLDRGDKSSLHFEDCLRFAISLRWDADTLAAIACGIAEAYYKEIPEDIYLASIERLDSTI